MAAPHVAGAVALLRQYNPNLTPEQIKTALLQGARDVDAAGEDNSSGYGLLDLEGALAYLPAPVTPRVVVAGVATDPAGDGILAAGETVPIVASLSVDDQTAFGLVAHIKPLTAGAVSSVDSVVFGTVTVGTTVTNSDTPFRVTLPSVIRAGDSLRLELSVSGEPPMETWTDTISLLMGLPAGAAVTTVGDGTAALSVSNFGQFGLAPGSALDAGGAGWTASLTPANTLYEGALVVMAVDGGIADASRRTGGELPFDFAPIAVAEFDDSRAAHPVGVQIVQAAYHTNDAQRYEYTTVTWTVRNRTASALSGVQLGLLLDIDLTMGGEVAERAFCDAVSGGVYHVPAGGQVAVGVAPLSGPFAARRFIANPVGGKTVLNAAAKRAAFTMGTSAVSSEVLDYFEILATNPVDIAVGESVTVAMAFIVTPTAADFPAAAADARDRWLRLSGITDDGGTLEPPSKYRLSQNYPNPFNASTIIPVDVDEYGAAVHLEVLDLLGRTVRTLVSEAMPIGRHLVTWDGTDAHGSRCASGVYFVRLTVSGASGSVRRVVLLK